MKTKNDFHVTPTQVVKEMVSYIPSDAMLICDPFAGTGAILEHIPSEKTRYYYEIDKEKAVQLSETYNLLGFDFCEYEFPANFFDCIVANPPFSNLDCHIENMISATKEGGTLILLLPKSYFLGDWDNAKLLIQKDLGLVDFKTAIVPCFLVVLQKDLSSKKKEIVSEISVVPTTKKGQYLMSEMLLYLGCQVLTVNKGEFLYPSFKLENRNEDDFTEWRVRLQYHNSQYFKFERTYDHDVSSGSYSVFFKKDYVPTIDDVLIESIEYLVQYYSIFREPVVEYYSFLTKLDEAQEYIEVYYKEMPNLKELRSLSYRLYTESKILGDIFPKYEHLGSEFIKLLNEVYNNSLLIDESTK